MSLVDSYVVLIKNEWLCVFYATIMINAKSWIKEKETFNCAAALEEFKGDWSPLLSVAMLYFGTSFSLSTRRPLGGLPA